MRGQQNDQTEADGDIERATYMFLHCGGCSVVTALLFLIHCASMPALFQSMMFTSFQAFLRSSN